VELQKLTDLIWKGGNALNNKIGELSHYEENRDARYLRGDKEGYDVTIV
jgi:hypothetical protein